MTTITISTLASVAPIQDDFYFPVEYSTGSGTVTAHIKASDIKSYINTFVSAGSLSSVNATYATFGTLQATTIQTGPLSSGTLGVSGGMTISGDGTFSGNMNISGTTNLTGQANITTGTWSKIVAISSGVTAKGRIGGDINGFDMTTNAIYYPNTNTWLADDTSKKAFAYIQNTTTGRHEFRTASISAVSPSITWSNTVVIDDNGLQATSVGNVTPGYGTFTYLTASDTTKVTYSASAVSTSTGALQVVGGVGIQGATYIGGGLNVTTTGTIATDQTTFNLVNTTATTVNAFGAATSLNLGATSGTATLANPTLVGSQTTQNVYNTVATTVNAFGAATSLNIGTGSGTITIANPTVTLTNATALNLNGASPSIATSSTGTASVFNTNALTGQLFGAATTIAIGNASGTTTISGIVKATGNLVAGSGTSSSSTTTGALIVNGGAGITGAVYAGSLYDNGSRVVTSVTLASGTGVTISSATTTGPSAAATVSIGQAVATTSTPTFAGMNSGGSILPSTTATYNLGSSSYTWSTVYGNATSANYADLAEQYLADAEYTPGTVVVFGGSAEITTTTEFADTAVAGAISTQPAHLMNSSLIEGLPLALRGRIPLKVYGPVTKGDSLVTSSVAGYAQSVGKDKTYAQAIFAKSLTTDLSEGEKVIEAVIL